MIIQIVSLIYNFLLISLAAWWIIDLKKCDRLETFEAIATIFIIIVHSIILLKIMNPSILLSIKHKTAFVLNSLAFFYWIGIFLPQVLLWREHSQKKIKLQKLGY